MGFSYIDLNSDHQTYYYLLAKCSAVHRITGCLRSEGFPHPSRVFIQIDQISPEPSLLILLCVALFVHLGPLFLQLHFGTLQSYVEISRDIFGNFLMGCVM